MAHGPYPVLWLSLSSAQCQKGVSSRGVVSVNWWQRGGVNGGGCGTVAAGWQQGGSRALAGRVAAALHNSHSFSCGPLGKINCLTLLWVVYLYGCSSRKMNIQYKQINVTKIACKCYPLNYNTCINFLEFLLF